MSVPSKQEPSPRKLPPDDSPREVSFTLSAQEFAHLEVDARFEGIGPDELAKRIVQRSIRVGAQVTPPVTPPVKMERRAVPPSQPPTESAKRHPTSRLAYAPIIVVMLLFLMGLILLLLYPTLQDLGILGGEGTRLPRPTSITGTGTATVEAAPVTETPSATVETLSTDTAKATDMAEATVQPSATPIIAPTVVITGTPSARATDLPRSQSLPALAGDATITATSTVTTTIYLRTLPGDTLANLIGRTGNGIQAALAVSQTIYLTPFQTIPLTVDSGYDAREQPIYVFPVQPPEIAKFEGAHHDYPATDIFVPKRSVVVAVTDGIIQELGPIDEYKANEDDPATRGGIYVSLIGQDGFRYYYSHLGALRPTLQLGDHVVAGELLGYTGDSGNARGLPQLHFGISPQTEPGDWEVRRGKILPFKYLQAWLANTSMSPALEQ